MRLSPIILGVLAASRRLSGTNPVETPDTTDTLWDKVVVAGKFVGADDSQVFTDVRNNAFVFGGSARLDVQGSIPARTPALYFPGGDGHGVKVPVSSSHPLADLALSDWSFDFWVKPTQSGNTGISYVLNLAGGLNFSWSSVAFGYYEQEGQFTVALRSANAGGGPDIINYSRVGSVTWNQWQHIELTRSGQNFYTFINGVLVQTGSSGQPMMRGDSQSGLSLGCGYHTDMGEYPRETMQGWLSDVRVTVGVARHTSSFTPDVNAPMGLKAPPVESDPYLSNVVMLLHGEGQNGTASIVDNGTTNVEALGGAAISNTQYRFGSSSIGMTGSSSYLRLVVPGKMAFKAQDFTFEGLYWFVDGSSTSQQVMYYNYASTYTSDSIFFGKHAAYGGKVAFYAANAAGSDALLVDPNLPPTGTWVRYAISRTGGNIYMLRDGLVVATASIAPSLSLTGDSPPVGYIGNGDSSGFKGYIDELRVTIGTGRYSANTPVQTGRFADPLPPVVTSNVSLLMHMEGADGSQVFIDSSEYNRSIANNGVVVNTANSKFGTSSAYFNGSSYLTVPAASQFNFGTGPFTIEMWVKNLNATGNSAMLSGRVNSSTAAPIEWAMDGTSNARCYMSRASDPSSWASTGGFNGLNMISGDWNHLALVGDGSTLRMFANGQQASNTISYSGGIAPFSQGVILGRGGDGVFNGYMDEVRITTGEALYTANFTPPTQSFDDPGTEEPTEPETPVSSGTASYRYWRIYTTQTVSDDNYVAIQEAEFRLTPGGAAIPAISASASSSYSGNPASKLVDGDYANMGSGGWISAAPGNFPQWVYADLAIPRGIQEIAMWPQAASGYESRAPKNFIIQASNDALAWTDIKTFTGVTNWLAGSPTVFEVQSGELIDPVDTEPETPEDGTYRFWQVYVTANNGADYTAIQEIELRSTAGGPDITTPTMPTYDGGHFATQDGKYAFDNTFDDYYQGAFISNGSSFPMWVTVDLGTASKVSEVALWMQALGGFQTRAPKDFSVRASNDNANWTVVRTFTGITNWEVGTPKVLSLLPDPVTFDPTKGGYSLTTSDDKLTLTAPGGYYMLTTVSKSTGKWYAEFEMISAPSPNNRAWVVLVRPDQFAYNAVESDEARFDGEGYNVITGDIVGVAFDADAHKVDFYRNGTLLTSKSGLTSDPLYLGAGQSWGSSNTYVIRGRFTAADLTLAAPTGYLAWDGTTP